jgi:hypothetical protein
MSTDKYNLEGYYDPTAYEALTSIYLFPLLRGYRKQHQVCQAI